MFLKNPYLVYVQIVKTLAYLPAQKNDSICEMKEWQRTQVKKAFGPEFTSVLKLSMVPAVISSYCCCSYSLPSGEKLMC